MDEYVYQTRYNKAVGHRWGSFIEVSSVIYTEKCGDKSLKGDMLCSSSQSRLPYYVKLFTTGHPPVNLLTEHITSRSIFNISVLEWIQIIPFFWTRWSIELYCKISYFDRVSIKYVCLITLWYGHKLCFSPSQSTFLYGLSGSHFLKILSRFHLMPLDSQELLVTGNLWLKISSCWNLEPLVRLYDLLVFGYVHFPCSSVSQTELMSSVSLVFPEVMPIRPLYIRINFHFYH